MGLELHYFYTLTPRQFYNIVEGYATKKETAFKDRWERTRLIAFYSAFNFESKNKKMIPTEFYPLPWEKEMATAVKQTPEEVAEYWKKVDAARGKK